MNKININDQIKAARKQKGLTQQELADEAGLSLRTVQRMENGKNEISGFSLKQISKVLELPLEQLIMQNVNQISVDTDQLDGIKALYLSSLLTIINPILGIIIPLILSYNRSNKSELYKKHLRFIIIFISITALLSFTLLTVGIATKILHLGTLNSIIGFEILILISIVLPVLTCIVFIIRFFQVRRMQSKFDS